MTIDQLTPAPYPVLASEVTADGLARSLGKAAADWHATRAPEDATADVAATALDMAAYLLRQLRMVAPDVADRIAVDAWQRTQEGPPDGHSAGCYARAADDPYAHAHPPVRAVLLGMADAARAGATAALTEPGASRG